MIKMTIMLMLILTVMLAIMLVMLVRTRTIRLKAPLRIWRTTQIMMMVEVLMMLRMS